MIREFSDNLCSQPCLSENRRVEPTYRYLCYHLNDKEENLYKGKRYVFITYLAPNVSMYFRVPSKFDKGNTRLTERINQDQIEQQNTDLQILFNTGLTPILKHWQLILDTPEYFYSIMPGAYLMAPVPESGPIPFGVLIRLWERKRWMDRCPYCWEWVCILGASGDLSTIDHRWWGICLTCKGSVNNNGPERIFCFTRDLYEPIRELLRVYDNLPPLSAYASRVKPVGFLDLLEIFQPGEDNR